MSEQEQRPPDEVVASDDDLSCPFCGSGETSLISMSCERGDGYIVECDDCGAAGPFKKNDDEACFAWNRRTA